MGVVDDAARVHVALRDDAAGVAAALLPDARPDHPAAAPPHPQVLLQGDCAAAARRRALAVEPCARPVQRDRRYRRAQDPPTRTSCTASSASPRRITRSRSAATATPTPAPRTARAPPTHRAATAATGSAASTVSRATPPTATRTSTTPASHRNSPSAATPARRMNTGMPSRLRRGTAMWGTTMRTLPV